MKYSRSILFIVMCMIVSSIASAQSSQRFTASKSNEYGLVYTLPLTEVDITIETEHTRETPGEFYNYARRHLGITDAIVEPSTSVTVKSVTISTHGVANPENRWIAEFKGGNGTFMLLSDDGIPVAINTEENQAFNTQLTLPVAESLQPTILETEVARQAMTQDMIRSSSISKRAELAAQRIFELRDMRNDILSGDTDNPPADGQAMQLVLDNLAGQEAALTAMFAGTKQNWTSVRTISIRPDSTEIYSEVIARISPFDGILDANNLAGAPLELSLEILDRGTLPLNDKGEPKRFPKGGVAYNIPGNARITISYEGQQIASADVPIAQLGCVFGMDPKLFTDKKTPSLLRFDPSTGAILELAPIQ